jgi:hypothetical protein
MNPRHRHPYDLTDRYGPRRLRGRSALDDEDRDSPLAAVRSPAFWASAAIVIVLAYLFVRAL